MLGDYFFYSKTGEGYFLYSKTGEGGGCALQVKDARGQEHIFDFELLYK